MPLTIATPTAGVLPIVGAVVIGTLDASGVFQQYIGPSYKTPCRVATTASITIATALNAGDTIDGVTLAAGDRVLVKNQAAPAGNGIYIAGVTPARSSDMDEWSEVPGSTVGVTEGAANADTVWICTSNAGGTLNTTAIDFVAFGNAAGSVLYNSAQVLTQAQAAQALANLSPSGGNTGTLNFESASNSTGILFKRGSTTVGQLTIEDDHSSADHAEIKLLGEYSVAIGPVTSAANFAIQLGAAADVVGGGFVYLGRDGVPTSGATTKNSQFLMFNSAYYVGPTPSDITYTGFNLRSISLDASGNVAARIAADATNGNVTAAATFQPPDGSATVPSISFPSSPTRGMWNDTGNAGIRFQNASGTGYMLLFNTSLDLKTGGMALLGHYGLSAASVGVSVGYINSGLWSNSNTDLRVAANGADCVQVTGTQVNVMSGIAFQLGNAAASAVAVASTHKLRILDSTGTAYDVLAIAA